ncbi:MAG: lipid IV(A) 3-deoxy-D-manno-octulosonic acid transferase [Campylobacterota bacterium]|nr:lipid IV(A) 3-deoxy-D-manno-octulosonic acid transferase [Campylobacterota bacterium]
MKVRAFSLFYYVLALMLYIISLPLLLFLLTKPKYKESIPARFFLWKNRAFNARNKIWFHACSLGEVSALKPLIDELGKDNVIITTITHTGYKKALSFGVETRYLPFEIFIPFWVKKQRALVVLEAELWYMLFATASAKGVDVSLLNARVTERSFPKSLRLRWFYAQMFSYVNKIFVQSSVDKERFEMLDALHVEVLGNIKLSQQITKKSDFEKPCELVVVGASTHRGEEELIVRAFLEFHSDKSSKLFIVPRHPERFNEVWELMKSLTNSCSRFSEDKSFSTNLILVDVMGELNSIYAISDIAIVGGAFQDNIGGHNPLEPAHYGCKIITGEHFYHQLELFKYVQNVQISKDEVHELVIALKRCDELDSSFVDEKIELNKFYKYIKEN